MASLLADDRRGEAHAVFIVANLHPICGRLDDAVDALQHAWRLYSELDDDQGRAWRSTSTAAIVTFEQAVEVFRRVGSLCGDRALPTRRGLRRATPTATSSSVPCGGLGDPPGA
jgi:hypothetical protein